MRQYLKQVFEIAQFSPECYVISLVYINRIIASCKVPLCGSTWRLKVLSALLLAQKVRHKAVRHRQERKAGGGGEHRPPNLCSPHVPYSTPLRCSCPGRRLTFLLAAGMG